MALDLQYTHYLESLQSYMAQDQTAKALILIGYVERDFIRFYRAGRLDEGLQFVEENLVRARTLLNRLTTDEKVAQLHALVDVLSFEGIQNHADVLSFVQLRTAYHQ